MEKKEKHSGTLKKINYKLRERSISFKAIV
jgi:hypothetical protein